MVFDPLKLKSLENTVDKLIGVVQEFTGKPEVATDISGLNVQIVDKLRNTPGMTQSRGTKFKKATPIFKLKDGTIIKTYRNSVGVDYIFLADSSGRMLFGGYVGWIHSDDLEATIAEIKTTFAASETDTSQTATKPKFQDIFKVK